MLNGQNRYKSNGHVFVKYLILADTFHDVIGYR